MLPSASGSSALSLLAPNVAQVGGSRRLLRRMLGDVDAPAMTRARTAVVDRCPRLHPAVRKSRAGLHVSPHAAERAYCTAVLGCQDVCCLPLHGYHLLLELWEERRRHLALRCCRSARSNHGTANSDGSKLGMGWPKATTGRASTTSTKCTFLGWLQKDWRQELDLPRPASGSSRRLRRSVRRCSRSCCMSHLFRRRSSISDLRCRLRKISSSRFSVPSME